MLSTCCHNALTNSWGQEGLLSRADTDLAGTVPRGNNITRQEGREEVLTVHHHQPLHVLRVARPCNHSPCASWLPPCCAAQAQG
jgi:hypothetical protein